MEYGSKQLAGLIGVPLYQVDSVIMISIFYISGGGNFFTIGIWTHEVEYWSKQLAGLIGVPLYQVDSVIMISIFYISGWGNSHSDYWHLDS